MIRKSKQIINNISVRIKGVGVLWRLNKTSSASLHSKFRNIFKYYPIFVHHAIKQQTTFYTNLNHNHQQYKQQFFYQQQQQYQQQLQSYFNKLKSKLKHNNLKQQSSVYQSQVRTLLHHGMQYLSLYYESLQSMIEGRREVLHDEGFIFYDGQSAQYKKRKFEKYLTKLIGRNQSQINKMTFTEQEERNKNKREQDDRE